MARRTPSRTTRLGCLIAARVAVVAGACAVGCAAYTPARVGVKRLLLNGGVASTRVRMIEGVAYVPVADVADALKQRVKTRGPHYEIVVTNPKDKAGPKPGPRQQ
jgi:hypothetical protein